MPDLALPGVAVLIPHDGNPSTLASIHPRIPQKTREIKRKAKRLDDSIKLLTAKKQVLPVLQKEFQRLTQRSVKYIRWLHAFLFVEAPWPTVVSALRDSYELS